MTARVAHRSSTTRVTAANEAERTLEQAYRRDGLLRIEHHRNQPRRPNAMTHVAAPAASAAAVTATASPVARPRGIERLVAGMPTSDGAGVKLTRVLTQNLQHRLDPFLMLDAFGSDDADDYIAGFPDHPHRGFETITYMIAGRMRHRDSAGHEGLLENGGVQWMTAGRGIIHSEIPEQDQGRMEGFQLWLNLPGRDKMAAPWYRDF
jgi:hypothetical protein